MKIAPSYVSVIDDPYLETIGYYEFDSEGMKGRGTLLVDDGILTDFLHSRETAAAMGVNHQQITEHTVLSTFHK